MILAELLIIPSGHRTLVCPHFNEDAVIVLKLDRPRCDHLIGPSIETRMGTLYPFKGTFRLLCTPLKVEVCLTMRESYEHSSLRRLAGQFNLMIIRPFKSIE